MLSNFQIFLSLEYSRTIFDKNSILKTRWIQFTFKARQCRSIFPKFFLFKLISFWNEPTKNDNLRARKTNCLQTGLRYEIVLKNFKVSSLAYLV